MRRRLVQQEHDTYKIRPSRHVALLRVVPTCRCAGSAFLRFCFQCEKIEQLSYNVFSSRFIRRHLQAANGGSVFARRISLSM